MSMFKLRKTWKRTFAFIPSVKYEVTEASLSLAWPVWLNQAAEAELQTEEETFTNSHLDNKGCDISGFAVCANPERKSSSGRYKPDWKQCI